MIWILQIAKLRPPVIQRIRIRNSVRFRSWDPENIPYPLCVPWSFKSLSFIFTEGAPRPGEGHRCHDKLQTEPERKPSVPLVRGCSLYSPQSGLWILGCQAACAFVSSMAPLLMVPLCMAQAWQMQLLVTSCPGLNLFTVTTPTSPVRRTWVIEWTRQELDLGPWSIQPARSLIYVNYLQLSCFCCKSQPCGFQKANTRGSIRSIQKGTMESMLPVTPEARTTLGLRCYFQESRMPLTPSLISHPYFSQRSPLFSS